MSAPDLVTGIGVSGCAVLAPIFLYIGLADACKGLGVAERIERWKERRNSAERRAEIERLDRILRKWMGHP
jgi:hypothetical protein